MAEEDAEIALLHQMQSQAGQVNGSWGDEGANDAPTGEAHSNTELNNHQEVKRENVADDQLLRALSPSATGTISDSGDHDLNPVSAVPAITIASQEDSRPSSRASSRKPKTIGGFLADDSDEEYDTSTPAQTVMDQQVPASNTPHRVISPSPLQNSVSQQEILNPAQNQGDSEDVQTSSTLPVNLSVAEAPSVQAPAAPVLTSAGPSVQGVSMPKARLPHDKIGLLEDRIKDDPRGDMEAWLSLISEHQKRNKLDDARAVYDKFLKTFPHAAEIWAAYIEMELENDNFAGAEVLFGRSLMSVLNIQLWSVYLNYIRRRNDLTNDVTGTARATISQAYDFVLNTIGVDKDSGTIWQEYVQFVKSAPGQMGGTGWQDQQKMDQLRKAYQRAVTVPMSSLNGLWKEYDQFEMSLNKITGRKFLQEKSPGYMSARSANTALENITRDLVRTTLPRLPPAMGFEGEPEYKYQVDLWNKWISWEQEDPLVLNDDEPEVFKQRVLYVYKQAVMALRFWPEIWVSAADWCYKNGMDKEGDALLSEGASANPESCLIAFKRADRLESTLSTDKADKGVAERGSIVRAPFDTLLDTLYDLIKQLKAREVKDLVKLEESSALDASISAIIQGATEDDDETDTEKQARESMKASQAKAIQEGYAMQAELLSRTISFAWIGLMRAMRRVQGKGSVKDSIGGSRKIFADARQRGKLTSDVYVAAALIEHNVYKDPAGTKIFERGAKLFPEDAVFTLEYLKHLLSIGDTTNARVTFETVVSRLTQKSDMVSKARPLYAFFHKYESQYGELSQISKLEQRMAELFPDDPKLSLFASRFSGEGFDPTGVRLIVSPAAQMRPKNIMQSIEQPHPSMLDSPRPQYQQEASKSPRPQPQYVQATNSPKRPFLVEDMDGDANRPRKLARGESPLKGAAGRRLDQQKRLQQSQSTPAWHSNSSFVIPRDITFLLSIIPRADLYNHTQFIPENLVRLLRETIVPDYSTWKTAKDESQAPTQSFGRRPRSVQTPRQDVGQIYPGSSGSGFQSSYAGPPPVAQSPYGPPAAAYGIPSGSAYAPPLPDPSRAGFVEVDEFGRTREQPVQLQPAASWYYHG